MTGRRGLARSRVLRGVPVVAILSVAGALALIGFTGQGAPVVPHSVRVSTGASAASTLSGRWPASRTRTAPAGHLVADAVGPSVSLFTAPDVAYAEKPTLANPTHEGLPVVFLVLENRGTWLRVRVSSRPNDLVLWVKKKEVALRRVPNRVLVEVGANRVTVLHGDDVLLQETAAVGAPATPTPLGHFFVDGIVPLSPGTGPYGTYQVSVAGFSEVLRSFGGGVGQIAIHGTNRPGLLGQDVSNGCVRLSNEAIGRVAELAPLGTPVDIVA